MKTKSKTTGLSKREAVKRMKAKIEDSQYWIDIYIENKNWLEAHRWNERLNIYLEALSIINKITRI